MRVTRAFTVTCGPVYPGASTVRLSGNLTTLALNHRYAAQMSVPNPATASAIEKYLMSYPIRCGDDCSSVSAEITTTGGLLRPAHFPGSLLCVI